MKDQIDTLIEEREQRLLREIRAELRRGRVFAALGFSFFVAVVLLYAFGQLDRLDVLPLLVGLGLVLISMARIPQRNRLLEKAAERLSGKN